MSSNQGTSRLENAAADAAGASDFELAAALYEAVFRADPEQTRALVRAHCQTAMDSTTACFALGDDAVDAADWDEAQAQAVHADAPADTPAGPPWPDRLGIVLAHGGRRLGFLGIAGHPAGYDEPLQKRFHALAKLLSAMLHARDSRSSREQALAESERQIRRQSAILDQIHDSVIIMDTLGYITGWNAGAERLFGYAAEEVIGQNILLLYADEEEESDDFFNAFLKNGSREMVVRRRKKSGELFWASVSLSVSRDESGEASGLIGYVVDISDRQAAAEKLHLHARIFECAGEAFLIADADERILSTNHAFTTITGWSEDEARGSTPEIVNLGSGGGGWNEIRHALEARGHWSGELQPLRRDGKSFPAWVSISTVHDPASGVLTHYCFVFSDITERKEAEARIYRLAYFDSLTNLPNRTLLYSLLEQSIAEARRRHGHGALLFVDINRFKHINDSFGHASADLLLCEIANRLRTRLRKEDIVSRLGSDEFVITLFDIRRRDDAAVVARKLLASLAEPYQVESHEILLSASIGISVFPDDGRDAESLIRNADVAMYRAKQLGNSSFLYYSREMNMRSLERLKLEGNLRQALEREHFLLHFQPQLDLASNRIVGAEALLRWEMPGNGMISPAQFIPVAEETGLIIPIGEWVVEATCRQLRAWIDAGLRPVKVAVNLSARQFSQNLPRAILDKLQKYGLAPELLEVEITESMLMHNADSVVAMMQEFATAGISMSLDDFGTGYSSLSYLKRFPIDTLKIDQSFVRGIPDDANDSAIATAIIGMAKALRLRVIAEGVETAGQVDFLKAAGCDEIQGYWYSKPVPAAAFSSLLPAADPAAA